MKKFTSVHKTKPLNRFRFSLVLLGFMLFTSNFAWGQTPGPIRIKGSGGAVTEISPGGIYYEVHTYITTGSSTFTPPSGASSVEYLVVAGGGGGGNTNNDRTGGGGGAGGVLNGTSYAVTVQSYTVTVGAGGSANTSGNNSVFGTLTAVGGGRGGQPGGNDAQTGGSGGGGYHNPNEDSGKSGTTGQGSAGGSGYDNGSNRFGAGGGGGQSQVGANGVNNNAGGKGGDGFTSAISGTSVIYAGGGGGGFQYTNTCTNCSPGAGGTGGGGAGGMGTGSTGNNGTAGTANLGGGGGGAGGSANRSGGAGGSGIVIVRYKAPTLAITTQPSSTVNSGQNFAQSAVIRLLNGDGGAVSGVTVTAAIESGTGSLNNATATTDGSGYATFTNLQITASSSQNFTLNFTVPGSADKVISNTIFVSVCPSITATETHSDITCFGSNNGSITITALGGASPWYYSVNNGTNYTASGTNPYTFTGLSANVVYKIRVKDNNGCESPSIP